MTIQKYLITIIQLLISFLCLFFIFDEIFSKNPNYEFRIISNYINLFYLIFIMFMGYMLNSFRLKIIVHDKISFLDILKANIISSFFSNINSLGSDIIRVYMFKKKMKLISSFTYVLCDRIIGVTSKLILIIISLLLLIKINFILIIFALLTLIFLVYFLFLKIIPFFIIKFKKHKFYKKIMFDETIFYKIAKTQKLLSLISVSLIAHFFQVLFIYLISFFYDNNILFMHSLLVGPITMVLSALPVSFGGWGIRELTMIAGYNFFDIQTEVALSISITIGLISLFVSFFLTVILFIINFINNLRTLNND